MTTKIHVRPADCDTYGHVNNAAYISYMEYAFTEWLQGLGCDIGSGWLLAGTDSWQPVEIAAVYTRPAYIGQTLQAAIWMEKIDSNYIATGCAISHPAGNIAFQGYAKWCRVVRDSGESLPLPPEIISIATTETAKDGKPADTKTPTLLKVPDPAHEIPVFRWSHTVRRSEIRAGDWVHPEALFHWVEEAIYVASASAGWPAERIVSNGIVIVQHRHDIEIHTLPRRGEEVQLISRVVEVRKIRGTWRHDIVRRSDGSLLARNWSEGVFMTHDGRPCKPPEGMNAAFGWN